MINFGKVIVKFKSLILILSFLLLVPSVIGYTNTRINYDILSYLPKDIETMQGQDILLEEFGGHPAGKVSVDARRTDKDTKQLIVKEK